MTSRNLKVALAVLTAVTCTTSDAWAGGRGGGGGGGGGGRAGGGGGIGGGAGAIGAHNVGGNFGGGAGGGFGGAGAQSFHTPTFSTPPSMSHTGFSQGAGFNSGPSSMNHASSNNFGVGGQSTNFNSNIAGGNRTQFGNTNITGGNRTQINNNIAAGNRTQIGNANINNNRFNNVNVNRNVNITNINNINNINRVGGWGAQNPYVGFHQDFVHGYWNGHYNNWGWGGFGLGVATGFAAWGFGSMLYNWGYSPYVNPYYYPQTVVVQQQVPVLVYDYSQPINTQQPLPEAPVTDAAVASFESARDAFKAGDYQQALKLTDQALGKTPNDSALHEFRALVLFALKQYDQAAATLYAVLSIGPGWDWTTLISLYPNVDVYTAQLRALEDVCKGQAKSAAPHFVLAYQYMTQGYPENAAAQLKQVVQLQPGDRLSTQLLSQLTKPDQGQADPAAPVEPSSAPASTGVKPGNLVGTWTASPAQGTEIGLTIKDDGGFVWKVTEKGQPHQFGGQSTYGNDMLTLAQSEGGAMVGKVTWRDDSHFTFQVVGGGPADPGLSFSR